MALDDESSFTGHWRSPGLISAPSHENKSDTVKYRISEDLTGKNRTNWRKTPLYMVWAHLLNQLPPIPNASVIFRDELYPSLMTLFDSAACFQGIERPHVLEGNGDSVLVYSMKPVVTVEAFPRIASPIRALPFPTAAVLTVQVCLTDRLHSNDNEVGGIVTRLEPVAADPAKPTLPIDYGSRYGKRCW